MPTRAELKSNAKVAMRGRKPSVYLIALVYFLIVYVLDILDYKLMYPGLSITEITYNLLEGTVMLQSSSFTSWVLQLAITIMNTMLSVGFTMVCLNISRGLAAGFGELFDAFGMFFKFLWLNILMGIYIGLWSCLFVIPGIVAAYRYRMAVYIMIDNPEFSASECIRRSKEMMRGHKGELFVLDLSFIGWSLLTVIPFVSLYVTPYITTTEAFYYNALSGYIPQAEYTYPDTDEQNPSGGSSWSGRDPWDN